MPWTATHGDTALTISSPATSDESPNTTFLPSTSSDSASRIRSSSLRPNDVIDTPADPFGETAQSSAPTACERWRSIARRSECGRRPANRSALRHWQSALSRTTTPTPRRNPASPTTRSHWVARTQPGGLGLTRKRPRTHEVDRSRSRELVGRDRCRRWLCRRRREGGAGDRSHLRCTARRGCRHAVSDQVRSALRRRPARPTVGPPVSWTVVLGPRSPNGSMSSSMISMISRKGVVVLMTMASWPARRHRRRRSARCTVWAR